MTIDELNALTTLTAADEVPVWDSEESGEPTKKITASNLAASVKSLASLPNTTEMNTAIAQSTANIGTIVSNSANKSIAFTGSTKEVCRITLAPGVWVMYANLQFQGATVGQRQGGTIAISNADGYYNAECYSMLSLNDTMNHYVNMCYIVKLTDTTNYYLMAYDTITRFVMGTIKAVRII